MADRVHPTQDSPHSQAEAEKLEERKLIDDPSLTPPPGRSVSILIPPGETTARSGTYIVQLPKDQILRDAPPPKRGRYHGRPRPRRRRSRCCLITLLLLLISVAVLAGVFYLVYQPKAPKYSIESLSIQGFNVTSSSSSSSSSNPFSPRMDVAVRAENPNKKIGIYYAKGSSVEVSHSDIGELCAGVLPVFYQPTKNVTMFSTALTSSDSMLLEAQDIRILLDQEKKKQIPLKLNMEVPVKIKLGSIKTWTIVFKVRCRITVDSLIKDASIVDKDCSVKFKPWE